MSTKFSVGQTVYIRWYRDREGRPLGPYKVTKVGRAWIYLGARYRFDRDLHIDGGRFASPGRVYLSEQDYCDECERKTAWRAFADLVKYQPPPKVSVETIEQARALLFGVKTDA